MLKLMHFMLPIVSVRECPKLAACHLIRSNRLPLFSSRSNGGDSNRFVQSLPDGLRLADKENKPIILLMHRHWCKSCQKLMAIVRGNSDVRATMQAHFVTVELSGEDEQLEEKYAPDGTYVPRIVFLSSKGSILKITNPNNMTGTNLYTYNEPLALLAAMKIAIDK